MPIVHKYNTMRKKLMTYTIGLNKIEKEQMKSGSINTRNTEKDIIVDLNDVFSPKFSRSNFSESKIAELCKSTYYKKMII